jgi:hypothetical protein
VGQFEKVSLKSMQRNSDATVVRLLTIGAKLCTYARHLMDVRREERAMADRQDRQSRDSSEARSQTEPAAPAWIHFEKGMNRAPYTPPRQPRSGN